MHLLVLLEDCGSIARAAPQLHMSQSAATQALAEFERQYVSATCLPTEFVERKTAAEFKAMLDDSGIGPAVIVVSPGPEF